MRRHFFDVGANTGQTFTDFLSKSAAHDGWDVWCFEPSPRHLSALMVSASHWSQRYKVHVCSFGIRGTSGMLAFHQKDDPRGDSFEPYLASDHETQNISTEYCMCVFAAGIVDAIEALTDPGDEIVLKLDCEGSEFSILGTLLKHAGALSRVREIYVEFHHISSKGSHKDRDALILMYADKGIELKQWMF